MNDEFKNAFIKTKAAGSIASGALDEVCTIIKPGISTNEIDNLCYQFFGLPDLLCLYRL